MNYPDEILILGLNGKIFDGLLSIESVTRAYEAH